MVAAPGVSPRRGEPEAKWLKPLVSEVNQVAGQRDAFFAQPINARLRQQLGAFGDSDSADNLRGSCSEALDSRHRVICLPHRELIALAEPAPNWLCERVLQVGADVEERRRARPSVEVLVRAADRHVGTAVV